MVAKNHSKIEWYKLIDLIARTNTNCEQKKIKPNYWFFNIINFFNSNTKLTYFVYIIYAKITLKGNILTLF